MQRPLPGFDCPDQDVRCDGYPLHASIRWGEEQPPKIRAFFLVVKIPAVFFARHVETSRKRLHELGCIVANYAEPSEQIGVAFSREALAEELFEPFGNI